MKTDCFFGILSKMDLFLVLKGPVPNISPIGRRRSSNMLKKHVQFPEDFKCFEEEEDEVLCITNSNGNGPGPVDTPPTTINTLQY